MKLGLTIGACLLSLLPVANAADWKALKPQGYVSDFAGVVDAGSRAAIEEYAARVQQATGRSWHSWSCPVCRASRSKTSPTISFTPGASAAKKKTRGDGTAFGGDRKSRLEVGGGLGGIVPDGMAGLLLDEMRPALRQGNYGAAMLAAAQRLGETIAQSKGVQLAAPRNDTRVRRSTRDSIPWPIIFIGIFFLLMLLRRGGGGGRYGGGYGGGGGGFWTGLLLGQLLNSGRGWSGGGRDGGGFGGFDSGGGGGGLAVLAAATPAAAGHRPTGKAHPISSSPIE